MTADRRLSGIESSLQPLEIVLKAIAEAHEHPSLEAYARAIADVPVESAPLSRIGTEVEASIRAAMKGQDRAATEEAVHRAVSDSVFRYILFIRMNATALEVAELEGLRAAATFYWMGCLLGGPGEDDLEPDEWTEHQTEQRRCWRSWRAVVASLLLTLMVEDEAREELQSRYLAGQGALLGDVEERWERFAELVEHLWSLSDYLAPRAEATEATAEDEAASRYDERLAERVQRLADDARISTFERLGEMPRAVAIVERRLLSA